MNFFSQKQFDKMKLSSHTTDISVPEVPSIFNNPITSVIYGVIDKLAYVDKFASFFGFDQIGVMTSQITHTIRSIENIWKKINPNIRHIVDLIRKVIEAAICVSELFANPVVKILKGFKQ